VTVDCREKNVLWLAQVDFSCVELHWSKIPLMLTTKVTHLLSLLFRREDGVTIVVTRVYWSVTILACPDRVVH